jgi:hypothetical protein
MVLRVLYLHVESVTLMALAEGDLWLYVAAATPSFFLQDFCRACAVDWIMATF